MFYVYFFGEIVEFLVGFLVFVIGYECCIEFVEFCFDGIVIILGFVLNVIVGLYKIEDIYVEISVFVFFEDMDIFVFYFLSFDVFYCKIDNFCFGLDDVWVLGLNWCLIEDVMICGNIVEIVCVLVVIELFLLVVEISLFVIDFCDNCNIGDGFNFLVCEVNCCVDGIFEGFLSEI